MGNENNAVKVSRIHDREITEWLNFWIDGGNYTYQNRVLLIGDSVTRDYRKPLGLMTKIPIDFFGTTAALYDEMFFKQLDLFFSAKEYPKQKAHIQIGLHCIDGFIGVIKRKIPAEEFYEHFSRLADAVSSRVPEVVFATATPIMKKDDLNSFDEYLNDQVIRINEVIKRVAADKGIKLNDMYTLMLDYPHRDFAHFTPDGFQAAAKSVANVLGLPLAVNK